MYMYMYMYIVHDQIRKQLNYDNVTHLINRTVVYFLLKDTVKSRSCTVGLKTHRIIIYNHLLACHSLNIIFFCTSIYLVFNKIVNRLYSKEASLQYSEDLSV